MVEERWQSVCPLRLEFGAKASRLGAPPWHDAWDATGAQETLGKRQEKECRLNHIGLRENLQETIDTLYIWGYNPWFPVDFPLNQSIDRVNKEVDLFDKKCLRHPETIVCI